LSAENGNGGDELETTVAPDAAWEKRESGPVPLPTSRRRERISEVSTGSIRRDDVQAQIDAVRTPMRVALADAARASADLDRRIGSDLDEEEVLAEYLTTFANLFGGRRFVARLVAVGGSVDFLRSTGRLALGRAEQLRVTRSALAQAGVRVADARVMGIEVVDRYLPDFAEDAAGFDLLLLDEGRPIGVLAVEYHPGVEVPEDDPSLLQFLATQLAGALTRARLRHQADYLSGYLARLLDHANVPILVIDRHRRIQVVSEALLALTGTAREELVGQEFSTMLPEPERAKLLPAVISALRGRAMTHFEIGIPRAEGGVVRLSLNLVSLLNPEGDVEGVIAIGRDLTEVRKLEEQIIQAEKLATLGQLAAGVVHELNNPLTSISVYGEYLHKKGLREDAPEGDVEKLRRIVQSAERILRFTRDLVTYARPSIEEPRALDVHEVLEQAAVFCEHVLGDASASVDKSYVDDAPKILGVRGQLHQVFINLITNACHAMPEGAGRLELSTRVEEKRVVVLVRDNGSGIPAEQLDRIFEPFFSTKGQGKGTGLGLSIVRNIVQQHGGAIDVRSEPGRGTTFVVSLPHA